MAKSKGPNLPENGEWLLGCGGVFLILLIALFAAIALANQGK